jgi:hypothetical protein
VASPLPALFTNESAEAEAYWANQSGNNTTHDTGKFAGGSPRTPADFPSPARSDTAWRRPIPFAATPSPVRMLLTRLPRCLDAGNPPFARDNAHPVASAERKNLRRTHPKARHWWQR